MPSRPRDMSELRHPSDRPRRSLNPRKRRGSPAVEFQVFNFGCLVRALHAAALRRLPPAVAGAVWARGSTHKLVGVRSGRRQQRDWQGLNKPANLSFRGRGYRRDTIRYQTQTLGAHRDPKIAAPRAASPNSGSLLARRISAFRAPRAPRRAAPPPRRVGTHIPDMRAPPPRPPSPPNLMLGARRFYAVERSQLVRRRR